MLLLSDTLPDFCLWENHNYFRLKSLVRANAEEGGFLGLAVTHRWDAGVGNVVSLSVSRRCWTKGNIREPPYRNRSVEVDGRFVTYTCTPSVLTHDRTRE